MRNNRNIEEAFTLLELVAIVAVITVLLCVLWPALRSARARQQRIGCVSHLKNVGLSARTFATDNTDKFPSKVSTNKGGCAELVSDPEAVAHYFRSLSNELSIPFILVCPADARKAATDFVSLARTNISYFVGWDADESTPQDLLAGDRPIGINGQSITGLLAVGPNARVAWTKSFHGKDAGNFVLGDGSVQQSTTALLVGQIKQTSGTNRLLIP